MGYKVLYDNQLLFDPYTDDRITDTKLSSKLNAASYFDFTIAPTHSLYSKLAERAGEVRIYFNNLILFKGEITKMEEDFEGNYSVSCTGVLDYLTATRVRPYSTVEGEQPLKAPSSYEGYFQWLIDQHNSNCLDSRKHFSVGVNQGNMLDKNNYIYRASEQRPTTASEIEDKILNSDGGYLFVRYEDDLNILDLYADVHDVNTQIIDYGVNMLDFTKTTTAESQYTAVVATGYTPNPPEGQPDAKMKPITLEGCTDGGTPYSSTIVKMGDRVYDVEAVARYGYHEYYVSNTDITTYDGLLYYACKTLNTLLSPALTISVKAVDLALIMGDKYKHLQLGQAVRIRSKPRKVDEYLMVNSIDLDLMNPENTTFDLGASYDTLTGQQSAYLKTLNASINASLDTVDALSTNVKNSAKLAQEAKDKADTATDAAADAAAKADKVTDIANSAVNKAEDASSKADTAISTSNDTKAKVTLVEKKATEAKTAADTAKKAADDATTAANSAQSSAEKANEAASNANTAASNAQSTADSALSSAAQANKDVGNVKTQITAINKEMTSVKQDAATLRDDLTGQITTVKETMEADYTKKSELSATESNLKTEISKSAAGIRTEVSQTYSTKKELETTTKAAQTAQSTADAAKKAAESNASDLANAVSKFDGDITNLKDQIDGAIQTWFYDGIPNALTEPEVNWTTDKDRQTHLGDLYYDNQTGFCYRYMNQNGVYSWGRIQDTEVTKALADAANAQTTANAKKRIFITTPKPPYDIGDLWVQGSNGDIMRCQTPKLDGQAYAEADWVKASKYTDDTAVTNLSNTVEKTYATKSTVNQLSDRIEQTVSSVEEVRTDASAAKTTAENAKKAADDAAAAANTAHETATAAQTAANKAQEHATSAATAASTAKANADAAQAAANKANAALSDAQKNLEDLQNRADVTDEELTAAKNAVASAQTAADAANSAASKANKLATTAQSTADTAKQNAATAQSKANAAANAASTAQSTADTAKANAKKAQDDVNALKNRVTQAETSIKQNSEAIALRATKTEVITAIDNVQADATSKANASLSESKKYTDAQLKITSESITSTVSKTYATKTSLTQTANDLTIDFNNKINNINKYVRFVDGNVILGEAGNPTTLKLTNDHLDILNKTNVVAKFAENTIELGNNSYLSEIKLCKGLATIQGYTEGGNGSDPLISIGASSGVRLYATRETNAGHLTTGTFNVLTSSDASNSETTMSSSSFLRGSSGTILEEAAVSVNTSNTGDSACNITASKIRINSRDVFTLTKLWSGNLSKGGSVNVSQGSQYTIFAVRQSSDELLMIGIRFKNQLHCYASYDSGTETRHCRASFRINGNLFQLMGASNNLLNGVNSAKSITEIYGIF